jgi:hypothetical protein
LEATNLSLENQSRTNQNVMTLLGLVESRQVQIENLITRIQEVSTAIETLQKLENQLNRLVR